MPGRLWLGLLLFSLACQNVVAVDDIAQQQSKLDTLRQQIKTIKSDVASLRGQQTSEQKRLEKTEKEIGEIASELHRLDDEAAVATQRIQTLGEARKQQQRVIGSLQQALRRELQSAYAAGRQQRIKLMLNQQHPATLGRLMIYQGYLAEARGQRLQLVRTAITTINDIEQQLLDQQSQFAMIKTRQIARAAALQSEQGKRQTLLTDMQQQIQKQSGALSGLQQDEQQLQTLLKSLQKALRAVPPNASDAVSLKTLKGKLAWPVYGKITQRYGSKQMAGGPASNGLFITTVAGADVTAIAAGRVAFADWLRGFGLLLILDHGNGYMSLYGHNRSFYRQVGDWASRGEVVAAAGNSGGQLRDGLYLELRHNGQPFNPVSWFSGKPRTMQAGP